MAGKRVIITNAAGENYAVEPRAFEAGAEDRYKGFSVQSWEDGEAYDGPKTAAALRKAQDASKGGQKAADKPEKAEG